MIVWMLIVSWSAGPALPGAQFGYRLFFETLAECEAARAFNERLPPQYGAPDQRYACQAFLYTGTLTPR